MSDVTAKGRRLDVRLRVCGAMRVRLLERPGAWMEDAALEALVAGLRDVADRCTGSGALRYGVLSGDRNILARTLLAVLFDARTGEPVGFNAMILLDLPVAGVSRKVLHTGLCMVRSEYRRKGLAAVLNVAPAVLAFVRGRLAPLWITNVTQVPAAAGMFARALVGVYPTPDAGARPSPEHRAIGQALMERHRSVFGVGGDATFDPDTFVIRNAYTGGSLHLKKRFEECALHRDPRFNELCRSLLDYGRGDDLLQVGRMTLGQAGRLVVRLASKLDGPRRGLRVLRQLLRRGPAALQTGLFGARTREVS